jgi:hypothetical protein
MSRFLPIAALALLACSAARAQTDETSNLTLRRPFGETQSFADFSRTGGRAAPGIDAKIADPPAVHAASEFHAPGAIAALTLLLCGVAVLKGSRRE